MSNPNKTLCRHTLVKIMRCLSIDEWSPRRLWLAVYGPDIGHQGSQINWHCIRLYSFVHYLVLGWYNVGQQNRKKCEFCASVVISWQHSTAVYRGLIDSSLLFKWPCMECLEYVYIIIYARFNGMVGCDMYIYMGPWYGIIRIFHGWQTLTVKGYEGIRSLCVLCLVYMYCLLELICIVC